MMFHVGNLPYLTKNVPGIGGKIKTFPEDFVVEEVPLYQPCGEGTHIYFVIEKYCLTTMRAVEDIARALNRQPRDVGFAGLKDSDAVTRQMLSIEHVEPSQIENLSLPRIRILNISRHSNKLKLGHLAGNRFAIRIRDVDIGRIDDAKEVMEVLSQRGVPNYFGPQRFGMRGDTWEIGRAMLHRDFDEALSVMLGRPGPDDYDEVRKARELYETGDYEAAAETWPGMFSNERRACRMMAKSKSNARRALGTVEKRLKSLFVSAYQSQLFNQVVAKRIDSLDKLILGDLAWRHDKGAVFMVDEPEKEQPRCDAFEISPTGPMFGHKMIQPAGEQRETEDSVLEQENLILSDWQIGGKHKVRGGRRPLRFQLNDVSIEADSDSKGQYLELTLLLESGCYATVVLREICK